MEKDLHQKLAEQFDSVHYGMLQNGKLGGLGGRVPVQQVKAVLMHAGRTVTTRNIQQRLHPSHKPTLPIPTSKQIKNMSWREAQGWARKFGLSQCGDTKTLQDRLLKHFRL